MTISDFRRCVRAHLRDDVDLSDTDVELAIKVCTKSIEAAYLDHTTARNHALDCLCDWYLETLPNEKIQTLRDMLKDDLGKDTP